MVNNYVKTISIDAQGNIWVGFGSNERKVSRFDGSDWTTFDLFYVYAGSHVNTITKDSQGNMWFGTYENGVIKYDGTSTTLLDKACSLT